MKKTRPIPILSVAKATEVKLPQNLVSVCSTRNNCRISVVLRGRLEGLSSVRNSRAYPGYERRLGIAQYTFARNFARRFLRKRKRRKASYVLYVKGSQKHAVLGLLDGGMRFSLVVETSQLSFNGCISTKPRRTGRRRKKHVPRIPRVLDRARFSYIVTSTKLHTLWPFWSISRFYRLRQGVVCIFVSNGASFLNYFF